MEVPRCFRSLFAGMCSLLSYLFLRTFMNAVYLYVRTALLQFTLPFAKPELSGFRILPQPYFAFMASSSSTPQQDAFSRASSSTSHKDGEDPAAFSGIEPPNTRRGVSESTRLYDVFINHRGPDVKSTLALQLYKCLEKLNITAFLDSEEKELGVSFTSTIEKAIRSAAVHIAIFSKGYAESPWCLEELVLMLRSKAKIIPVFYDVEPSALRHIEKGVYGSAFSEYENKKRYMEKLEDWKKALQSVSFIAGEKITSFSDCEKIISAVQKEVEKKRPLYVAKYPVGLPKLVKQFQNQCIDKLVQDFESRCGMSKQVEGKSKIVGIFGMGGVGKTTLSKEFFNRKRLDYSSSCFLFDVREASVNCNLSSLQLKLLTDLFDVKDHQSFTSVEDGKSRLSSHIHRSGNLSFLIVVDDIDNQEQLDALLISDMLDKFDDSMAIVTTRDAGVLISAGITVGYHLKGLDTDDAKQLFCWHAFRQPYPSGGWEELVDLFVEVCGGLPLSLQVLGSHVHGRDGKFWELELTKIKKTLPQDILKRLRISIDTLDNEEKKIFMDVACFFIGELTTQAIKVWEASGWSGQHALRRLKNKCLVEEIKIYEFRRQFTGHPFEHFKKEIFVLRMHDHLRDLGREMADELSNPRRLWRSQHLQSLESKGFKNILTQPNIRCLHSFMDRSVGWHIKYFLGESGNTLEPSTDLLWLELEYRYQEVTNIPPWIPLQNLQFLRIIDINFGASLKELWQTDLQAPFVLRELVINKILDLNELSLGLMGCLEKVEICDCKHLQRVTGISDLTKLAELNISECWELEFEKLSFVRLSCIKLIEIHDCKRLESVTGISDLIMLEQLNIVKCGELEFEKSSLRHLHCLKKVTIQDCKNLTSMTGISQHTELVELKICDCEKIEELSLSLLRCLEKLVICNCEHLKSVTGISDLTKLMELNISNCGALELENLSLGRLYYLQIITVHGCKYLKSVTGIFELRKPPRFDISYCETIEESSFIQRRSLKRLAITDCGHLKSVTGIGDLTKLKELNISKCGELEELSLVQISCLERITIQDHKHQKSEISISDLTDLEKLHISSCGKIEELSLVRLSRLRICSISDVPTLKRIELKGCHDLQRLDGIFWNLVKLNIYDCPKLERVADIHKLHSLERMQLFYCSGITIWNCIVDMEKLPSEFITIIGTAVDGPESTLNANLFWDLINANSIIQMGMENTCNHLGRHVVGAIILCAVIVVHTCTAAKTMNEFMRECDWSPWLKFEGRPGEWIITSVTTREDEIKSYLVNKGSCFPFDYLGFLEDVSVTEVTMPVMKGEENKISNVLRRIVNKLYRR